MQFHPDDFIALSNAVIADGGVCLVEPCGPKPFKLKQPNAAGKNEWKTLNRTYCGQSALMEIPYDPKAHIRLVGVVDHLGESGSVRKLRVCAVDDCVGLWPRYKDVISERSFQS